MKINFLFFKQKNLNKTCKEIKTLDDARRCMPIEFQRGMWDWEEDTKRSHILSKERP